MHGNELLALPAAAFGAAGCVVTVANMVPAMMSAAWAAAARGDLAAVQRYQEEISSLMPVFGLLEAKPQDSTVMRLMAIKAVLQVLGVIESHMAQLVPPIDPDQLERVSRFVENNEVLRQAKVAR
jgi:dihydrodipicolinate synthase/N-acetylneuraminate lyase